MSYSKCAQCGIGVRRMNGTYAYNTFCSSACERKWLKNNKLRHSVMTILAIDPHEVNERSELLTQAKAGNPDASLKLYQKWGDITYLSDIQKEIWLK